MTPATEYLTTKRHLSQETIDSFSISYCGNDGSIYVPVSTSKTFPKLDYRFKNSTLFPISDLYNNIVGVSARPLQGTDLKYVNTVYPKASHLYGLNVTWKYCLQEDKVYVVEGNVDAMTLFDKGIKNVVALLGSNFSKTQLCLLRRFAKSVVFVPDGDKAGANFIKKIREARSLFSDADIEAEVLKLPTGADPDSYVLANGVGQFLSLERISL